jgi:hypothetical protein
MKGAWAAWLTRPYRVFQNPRQSRSYDAPSPLGVPVLYTSRNMIEKDGFPVIRIGASMRIDPVNAAKWLRDTSNRQITEESVWNICARQWRP